MNVTVTYASLRPVTKNTETSLKIIKADQKPPTHTDAGFGQAIDARRRHPTRKVPAPAAVNTPPVT